MDRPREVSLLRSETPGTGAYMAPGSAPVIGLAKRGDHQQEAATIAALVSGSRASDVLSEGAERFRAIRLDAISTNG